MIVPFPPLIEGLSPWQLLDSETIRASFRTMQTFNTRSMPIENFQYQGKRVGSRFIGSTEPLMVVQDRFDQRL